MNDKTSWKESKKTHSAIPSAPTNQEEKFQTIFEYSPLAIMFTDKDGSITDCNEKASKIFGSPREKVIGFSYKNIKNDSMREAIALALNGEKSHFEGSYLTVTGNVLVEMNAYFSPSLATDGSVTGMIGIFEDISARKQVERELLVSKKRLKAVKEIGELANSSLSLEVVLERILTGTIKAAGGSAGMIFLKVQGTETLKWGASLGLSDEFVVEYNDQYINIGEGLTGNIAKNGEAIYLPEDSSHDPRIARPVVIKEDLNSFIGVPIRAADKIIGVMNILTRKPIVMSEQEIPLITAIGAHVGSAIQNALLFKQLQLAETDLKVEQKFMATLINSVDDTFFVFDAITGKALRWNKKFREITGYSDQEIAEKKAPDAYYGEEELEGEAEITQRILQNGKATIQMNLLTRDQREIPFEYSLTLIHNPTDGHYYIISIGRDLSERNKIQQERLKFHKLESIGILAGGIAHDFNNLLTTILGNISLARMYLPEEEKIKKYFAEAEKASFRAQDLTQQLLTFSKGGNPIKKMVSLPHIIRDTAGFVMHGSKVVCDFDLADNLWLLDADEGQVNQVFHNLLLNSVQSMPEGGNIQIKAENRFLSNDNDQSLPAGKFVWISITDQGKGITDAHIDQIFDPYFSTKEKGNGLGLATVYSIINKHHGHISVESKAGVGTTFRILLPASKKKCAKEKNISSLKIAPIRKKILVMDDEDSIRRMLSNLLKQLDCEVATAGEGLETIRLYRQAFDKREAFDAVILDLTIPGGMGGEKTNEALHKINPNLITIVSSGYSNASTMADFVKHGFKACLTKPYTIERLFVTLQDVFAEKSNRP